MVKELEIDSGNPVKRFQLIGEETPYTDESYDTATETEEAWLKLIRLYEALDERKLCTVRKIKAWDRGPENKRDQRKQITLRELHAMAAKEAEKPDAADKEAENPAS